MRNAFAEALYEEAVHNPNIYVVVADISPVGSMQKFREEYPDRFINVGVSEQSMISICAGLALKDKQPFAYTIATFSLYRPFEFIRNDLCYQNLPVTIVGMGAGVIYSDHGGTHHTMEDIAIASALPNMQIIAPCDPNETTEATKWCAQQKNGPVYLRLGKSGEPNIGSQIDWGFGELRFARIGKNYNPCIITYGVISKLALEIAEHLNSTLVICSTLKPLHKHHIGNILETSPHVVVIEEHVPQGGLASQVKQLAWDIKAECKLSTFTLQDKFIHNNGRHKDLLAAHGLSYERIIESISA